MALRRRGTPYVRMASVDARDIHEAVGKIFLEHLDLISVDGVPLDPQRL